MRLQSFPIKSRINHSELLEAGKPAVSFRFQLSYFNFLNVIDMKSNPAVFILGGNNCFYVPFLHIYNPFSCRQCYGTAIATALYGDGRTHQHSQTLGCYYKCTKVICFKSYGNASQI